MSLVKCDQHAPSTASKSTHGLATPSSSLLYIVVTDTLSQSLIGEIKDPSTTKPWGSYRTQPSRPRSLHTPRFVRSDCRQTGRTVDAGQADLRNFFGSLDHGWLLRFAEHRVEDPRIISLIRRWLKAGGAAEGVVQPSDEGAPQGGSMTPFWRTYGCLKP